MKENKFYITTAIDYANGVPHIGHALEKVQTDVLARFHRAQGNSVWFLTGTDEHGATNVRAAEKAGEEAQAFIDKNAAKFKALREPLNLSWDDFIRTTDQKRHWPGAQKLWQKLHAAGDLYQKKYRGLYCVGHEAFVTEKDLVDGKCADHQKEPEMVEEENWFFRLSKYTGAIKEKIESNELLILPTTRRNEILSLLNSGLEDVSFSRPKKDLPWGIPVPNDTTQTMYVWCDALANYITAIGYNDESDEFKKWWPAGAHVIGKDILRFHAAIWPGMLLSAGLPLPKSILVHGFITVDNQKISKTVGNVIDPVALVQKYGTDAVRYYLLREIPSGEDGDFSYEKFEARYNGDLAHGLGNFASRTLALGERLKNISEKDLEDVDKEILDKIEATRKIVSQKIDRFSLHEALSSIWELISFGDGYINKTEPWKDGNIGSIVGALAILSGINAMILPFLPGTANKISEGLRWKDKKLVVKKISNLFPPITP